MSNKACLQTLQNVKRQWAEASLTELSAMEEGVAVVLTGNQIFPSNNQKVTYTAIASEGMTGNSLNLVFIASLPIKPVLNDSLYAFLLQATAVMAPLEFIVDLESGSLLIRQGMLVNRKPSAPGQLFVDLVNWFSPRLTQGIQQIQTQNLPSSNARQMADYLSEEYFEAIAE